MTAEVLELLSQGDTPGPAGQAVSIQELLMYGGEFSSCKKGVTVTLSRRKDSFFCILMTFSHPPPLSPGPMEEA